MQRQVSLPAKASTISLPQSQTLHVQGFGLGFVIGNVSQPFFEPEGCSGVCVHGPRLQCKAVGVNGTKVPALQVTEVHLTPSASVCSTWLYGEEKREWNNECDHPCPK